MTTGTTKPQDTHTKGALLPSDQAPWCGKGRIMGCTMQKNHEPNREYFSLNFQPMQLLVQHLINNLTDLSFL